MIDKVLVWLLGLLLLSAISVFGVCSWIDYKTEEGREE